MGLFIGASILTVLELFDYAYEVSGGGVPGRGHGRGGVPDCPPPRPPKQNFFLKELECWSQNSGF